MLNIFDDMLDNPFVIKKLEKPLGIKKSIEANIPEAASNTRSSPEKCFMPRAMNIVTRRRSTLRNDKQRARKKKNKAARLSRRANRG